MNFDASAALDHAHDPLADKLKMESGPKPVGEAIVSKGNDRRIKEKDLKVVARRRIAALDRGIIALGLFFFSF